MSEEHDDVGRYSCGAEFTLLIGQARCFLPEEAVDSVTKQQQKMFTTQHLALIQAK